MISCSLSRKKKTHQKLEKVEAKKERKEREGASRETFGAGINDLVHRFSSKCFCLSPKNQALPWQAA